MIIKINNGKETPSIFFKKVTLYTSIVVVFNYEGYAWSEEKKLVRSLWNGICSRCGCSELESIYEFDIHHVRGTSYRIYEPICSNCHAIHHDDKSLIRFKNSTCVAESCGVCKDPCWTKASFGLNDDDIERYKYRYIEDKQVSCLDCTNPCWTNDIPCTQKIKDGVQVNIKNSRSDIVLAKSPYSYRKLQPMIRVAPMVE